MDVDMPELQQYGVSVVQVDQASDLDNSSSGIEFVLLDGSEDGKWVKEQVEIIQAIVPHCKMLVSMPTITQETIGYLQLDISGVLRLPKSAEQLVCVLNHIQAGHYYLDHDFAQLLAMRQIKKMLQPFNTLTSREFDVFCMIAEGCSLQVMAKQLGVSSKTVSNCQSQIKAKLDLEARVEIIKFAKKHGLIEK